MGKLVKIIAWLVGIVVVVFIAVIVAATVFIDPNDYKDQITTEVRKATGRDLTIEGDIGLTFFPWVGVELGALQLSNAEGFGDQPMASIDSANVRVKLMPLLSKQVEMDTVVLNGLDLNLARNASGASNWDDLVAGKPEAEVKEEEEAPKKEGAPAVAALAIGGLDVRDAHVVWDDQQAKARYEINALNMQTGELELGAPFDLEISFDVSSAQPAMQGHVDLNGEISMNPMAQTYALQGAELKLSLAGKDVPAEKLEAQLNANISADLIKQTLALADLKLQAAGLTMDGGITGTQILDAPAFAGKITVAEFSPRDMMGTLGMHAPQTADQAVLTRAAMSFDLKATADSLEMQPLTASLDDTNLKGTMGVSNFAKPAIRFDLDVDGIDVDRYLPPAQEGKAEQAGTPATAAAAGAEGLPLDTLRGLNLNGTLRIGKVKVMNLNTQNIRVTVSAKDGLITMHPMEAALYQGSYTGKMQFDARAVHGNTPRLAFQETLKGVQAEPLLQDLTGDAKLAGTANSTANFTAQGTDADQVKRTLNGNASFSFTDGAVKGVNVAKMIRDAYAKVKGQSVGATTEPNQTDFTEMSGTVTATNGLLRNNDLSAKSPLLRVTGDGQANLVTEKIDYTVTAKVVGTLEGQGGRDIADLKNITVPIRVTGTFSDPSYGLDMASILKDQATQEVKKQLEEKILGTPAEGGDAGGIGDKLKGLFK